MRKRVLTAALGIIIVTVLVMTVLCGYVLHQRRVALMEHNLRSTAAVLAAGYTTYANYTDYAERVAGYTGYRVTLVSAEGELLDDSETLAYDVDWMQREEFEQARISGSGFYVRENNIGARMMYAVARAHDGTYIRLSADYEGYSVGLVSLLPILLLCLVVLLLLGTWASVHFTRSISQPIQAFSLALDSVMDGGEKLEPDKYPYEELQGMALAINHLSDQVEHGISRVEREHQRLDTILDTMKEGFILLDWEEDILLINNTARRVLGCGGKEIASLVFATQDIGILDAVAEVKKTGALRQVEYGAADGSYYEVTVSPTQPDAGGAKGIAIILSDVGDHLSTAKIRQDFFASASHELKTPITSVRGFAELLNTPEELDADVRKMYADRILRETQRMQTLIEDILMIARMESGELRYEREDVDFYKLVKTCCDDLVALATEADIEIAFDGVPCRLYASEKEMVEMVGNLCSNAVKYNRPGGKVRVRLWREEGSTMLTVYNTGEPIGEADAERIFERFYRIDKGRSKAVGGTGLGLAIVKHIVGRYGAKVSLLPGEEGNTFQVIFPPSVAVRA